MQSAAITRLHWLGYLEVFSWLILLFVAMPVKYIWNKPLLVTYVGWVHGILFILYCIHLLLVTKILHWPLKKLFIGGLAAFLPLVLFGLINKLSVQINQKVLINLSS